MKKHIITTILIALILLGGVSLFPHKADAAWWCIFMGPEACAANEQIMQGLFSDLGNLVLQVTSYVLTLSGIVLNMSIALTLNIKAIYLATPAIEQVWVVIRNISSIFIIFGLIYTSLAKILDFGGPSLGKLIKNIVIAGLLINFSLFFTRIAIDASNLISMQFYRAIAPKSQNVSLTDSGGIAGVLANSFTDGGISDVFMQSLKIPKIYNDKKGVFAAGEGGTTFKIVVATFLGSVLMITAALSFFAVSLAFIIRLVLLLLLMGFSPVFFVGMIFPKIEKEVSNKWMDYFKNQLIFMPVYLLFMYVALRFISGTGGEGFFAALDSAQLSASKVSNSGWLLSTVGLVFQYAIAIVLINIPLIAAIQTGGVGLKWAKDLTDSGNKWLKGLPSFAAQHSLGRGAKAAAGRLASSDFAARNPNMTVLASKALGGISGSSLGGSKGGYDKRFKEFSKARSDFADKSLKLNDDDKRRMEISTAAAMNKWDNETMALRTSLEDKKNALRMAQFGPQQDPARAKKIQEEMDKIEQDLAKRSDKERDKQFEKVKGASEKQAKQAKAEKFAANLEKGFNPLDKKARADAAKTIREKFKKDANKKLKEAIKDLGLDDEEEKPADAAAATPATPATT